MGSKRHYKREEVAQIIALKDAGLETKDIVNQTGISERTVRRWVARHREEGGPDVPFTKPRPGRPKKTNERSNNIIKRTIEKYPRSTARKIKQDNPDVFGEVSVRTVARRIQDLGYKRYRPIKKPILSKRNRAKRLAFAKKYITYTDEDWMKVFWSDESNFTVVDGRSGSLYRHRGSDPLDPRYTQGTVKFPGWLMFWGGFTGYGKSELVRVSRQSGECVNAASYLELLCDYLPDAMEKTQANLFQQDGATSHTAKCVTNWLKDCCVNFINDWPGQSPDLNPIENLWNSMKRRLQGKNVDSYDKLEREVRSAWNSIPLEECRNLALSMKTRLQEVIKKKGGHTKY
ncbi:Transposable element Tc1 transposase [Portunus trituberculatus]|uniref:Transposable element Tc1 transposase n=1 Tax=Portunus trituberculatus TaxID=210409 RepID=A0A5B7I4P9_PORTR|nr:Transposable element Tc1 transposase [Portunus trituberculatus]